MSETIEILLNQLQKILVTLKKSINNNIRSKTLLEKRQS